ncbi:hypothetical protein GCM10009799_10940 [Nocardiopsis rhodophaea]|uniref:Single-stranded DNA-binding protein n=1 Tax=Nocardiopsis rhodophaea TaxID=280238 RepID=A0ABN2SIN8_9ACTN
MQEKHPPHAATSRSTARCTATGRTATARATPGRPASGHSLCSAPKVAPATGTVPVPRDGRARDRCGHRNEVVVAGRVTAEPYVRELPSGDHLITWRISITRPPADRRPSQPADPITCVSFRPDIEEATRGWRIGDVVQVSGSLRRRFWRSSKGSTSVIEVEAAAVVLLEGASVDNSGPNTSNSGQGTSGGTGPSTVAARDESEERGGPGARGSATNDQNE